MDDKRQVAGDILLWERRAGHRAAGHRAAGSRPVRPGEESF